jgi:hypothetical protein
MSFPFVRWKSNSESQIFRRLTELSQKKKNEMNIDSGSEIIEDIASESSDDLWICAKIICHWPPGHECSSSILCYLECFFSASSLFLFQSYLMSLYNAAATSSKLMRIQPDFVVSEMTDSSC